MLRPKRTTVCILLFLIMFMPIQSGVNAANLLQKGMSGDQVVQLQNDLKQLGFFTANCTGYYGNVTQQAVRNLQRQYGYIQDGIAGSQTLSLISTLVNNNIGNIGILEEGSSGNDIIKLQENLEQLGYFNGDVTGYFGNVTKQAVMAFQRAYNLYCDGKVGSKTYEAIQKALVEGKSYNGVTLKKGASGADVKLLQTDLTKTGYYTAECTGYFGPYTEQVVKNIQSSYGYYADGVVGAKTYSLIQDIIAGKSIQTGSGQAVAASVSSPANTTFKIPWYGQAEKIFAIGTVATVLDVETGIKFKIKRTFGYNHADCETLTAADTAVMFKLFGGWSWERRAIIIIIGDTYIAASMAGMPHAGRDDKPSGVKVYNRSGDYGYGDNLDAVKGNNMNGVFDVHFYMSKTHSTNRVDARHQEMVDVANEYAKKNY